MSINRNEYGPVAFMKIYDSTIRNLKVIIKSVNTETNHIVAINADNKVAFGWIAKSIIGNPKHTAVVINESRVKTINECAPRLYKAYGISDISPYEHGWLYGELESETADFGESLAFEPILDRNAPVPETAPAALAIEEKPEIPAVATKPTDPKMSALEERVRPGTIWDNGKTTWYVRDTCWEILGGRSKLRVWIVDENGKRGQAVYAENIAKDYVEVKKK